MSIKTVTFKTPNSSFKINYHDESIDKDIECIIPNEKEYLELIDSLNQQIKHLKKEYEIINDNLENTTYSLQLQKDSVKKLHKELSEQKDINSELSKTIYSRRIDDPDKQVYRDRIQGLQSKIKSLEKELRERVKGTYEGQTFMWSNGNFIEIQNNPVDERHVKHYSDLYAKQTYILTRLLSRYPFMEYELTALRKSFGNNSLDVSDNTRLGNIVYE